MTPPLSALSIAALVNNGDISATDAAQSALQRAQERDSQLRAFVELWPEQALRAARNVDARLAAGERLPFAGVPIGVKAPGSRNAVQTQRLIAAGCVVIGVTSVPTLDTEWQTWGHTDRGPTTNPWRPNLSPGGSSAGSAAAVAAGIVPIATALDGAGSIRIPAAWCGVVGIKPTTGLIPTKDQTGLRVGGPITRTVSDAAAYLDVVAGTSLQAAVTEQAQVMPALAAWSRALGFAEVDTEVAATAREVVQRMTRAGLITLIDIPVALHDPRSAWLGLRAASAVGAGSRGSAQAPQRPDRDLNRSRLRKLFSSVDVLITPTTPNRPHGHAGPGKTISTALTWAFNLSGHPAITVPAGFTADGAPAGIQFVARHHDEATLIRLAAAWERLAPWPSPDML